ncbi:MAG: nicotinamide-nucleotide amidohydrolase family protein [Bacteriovoracaceae bacterium]
MKIGLIIIGNEILKGQTQDQHVEFLAKSLKKGHYYLNEVVMIPDQLEIITQTVKEKWNKLDVIITSGGVGPTKDDLTPEALRKVFPYTLQEVKNNFGAASGFMQFTDNPMKLLMALPGVPREFQGMVLNELIPKLDSLSKNRPKRKEITIRTFGIKEETIFFQLCPTLWSDLEQFSKTISSLPRLTGVDIVIEIEDQKELITKLIQFITSTKLNEYIWHIGDESVEEVIIQTCLKNGWTLSFAESCTGGLISHLLTNVPQASKVLNGSIVSYTNEIKQRLLHIPNELIQSKSVVSLEVATIMAENCLTNFKSDFALSITGLAGPPHASDPHPVGTFFVAIAAKNSKTQSFEFSFHNPGKTEANRQTLKQRFALKALLTLLKSMKN